MTEGKMNIKLVAAAVLILLVLVPTVSLAQQYELVNPEGVAKLEPTKVNPHPATLEGKTVVLRVNSKQNADNNAQRIAELLQQNVKNIKVIKAWEVLPDTRVISQGDARSKQIAQEIAALKPDLVIGFHAD
jgi:hypothetical protein